MGFRPRELSHFSDNAGCGLSVSTRAALRLAAEHSRTGPDGVPSLSFRQLLTDEMRRSVCFRPAGLLAPLRDARPARLFSVGPAPQAVPFALVIPMGRLRTTGSDSDCEAFAAGDGPSTTGSTRQHAGSVLPKPPQTTLRGRPSGDDSQTRPVRPTSPPPPLTDVPALRRAALGLGKRLPFCAPLRADTERMYHSVSEDPKQPLSPDDPRRCPGGEPPERPPLWGRLGLLGRTSCFAGGGRPGIRMGPLAGVTPGYPATPSRRSDRAGHPARPGTPMT